MNKIYNKIGKSYNTTRKPDPRIFNKIIELLDCNNSDKIIDVGAGTGNYSYLLANKGFIVDALEPSEIMQNNGKKHINLNWILASAEEIPCNENYYDGALCTLAYHHFKSLKKSFLEIHRVLKPNNNFVIFTADPRKAEKSWLDEYFYDLIELSKTALPDFNEVLELLENIFNNTPQLVPFYLPDDLKDSFFYSAWKYPEKYLDENFRNGISSFALADKQTVDKAILKLKQDIKSKEWDKKFSYIRSLKEYNCGYYFIRIKK